MESNNILFSIVVPFYETVDYVKETLDSIINQVNFNLDWVEVIVVNDGSNHDLLSLLKDYPSKFKHFNIYNKENGNWGSVINYVKQNKLAHGKYITILDSDDILASDALVSIASYTFKNPDIITSNFYRWYPTKNDKHRIVVHWLIKSKFFDIKKFAKKKHLAKTAYSFPLGKFYKTSLFYETNFMLQEKISYQDVALYHEMVNVAKTWQYVKKYVAYYRTDRPDSSSNVDWSINRIRAWIKTINYLDSIGSTSNAYMYCIYTPFRKACKKHRLEIANETITLHRKFRVYYICKCLHPAAKLVFKIVAKKMAKYSPIKFI